MFNLVPQTLFCCKCWRIFVIFRGRFRSLTAFAAEWCARPCETEGEKMGGGENLPLPEFLRSPPIFSPFSPVCGTPFRQ